MVPALEIQGPDAPQAAIRTNERIGAAPPIAFAVLAHKNSEQVASLIASLDLGANICVVHCDTKAGPDFERDIRRRLPGDFTPYIRFIERTSITWGGWGLAGMTLEAMKALLDWRQDWGHFVNLSGQCLPTRPVPELARFLASSPDANYVESVDAEREFRRALRWAGYHYVELGGRLYFTPIPRSLPADLHLYKGSCWVMLSREFCRHVLEDQGARRIITALRPAKLPDELLIQTIICNGPYEHTRIDDNKRLIVWPGPRSPHPEILTMQHLPLIESPGSFFARKFDVTVDRRVVETLIDRARVERGAVAPPL